MSERYGRCWNCRGPHCSSCDGTGLTGDAMVYCEAQNQEEWKRDTLPRWGTKSVAPRIFDMEDRFYRNAPKTPALEKAVQTFHISLQRKKKEKRIMKFKEENLGGPGSSQNFVKLKDKEMVQGVFRGEIHDFKQHWTKGPQGERSEVCVGPGCMNCGSKKPSFRFRLNFVTKNASGVYEPKIFEQGWGVYEILRSMHKSGYDLEKTVVSITRNGTGRDTTYSILPIPGPNAYLTPEKDKQISAIKLLDLQNLEEPKEEYPTSLPSEDDGIPF